MVKSSRRRAPTPSTRAMHATTKKRKKVNATMRKKAKTTTTTTKTTAAVEAEAVAVNNTKMTRRSGGVGKVATPLRRSSRIMKARNRATSYFDVIPSDVVGTLVKKVFAISNARDSLKSALAIPREGVAQVLRTIEEGNDCEFNTVGTQAYKQLGMLMRDVGYAVRKLKFEDKLVTKAYSKIVRTHCPNLEVLSVSFSLSFGLWRIPADRCVPGVETMIEALTNGGKKLPELRLKLGDLTQSYMQMLVKHVKNIGCLVLDWVAFEAVGDDCFQQLWTVVGSDNVAIKKIVLNPPAGRHMRDERLALPFAREHCPKVNISLIIDGESVSLTSV